jgi:hypothetical protein
LSLLLSEKIEVELSMSPLFVTKTISRVVPQQNRAFEHRFGGPPIHQGTTPPGSKQPLHLLYTFDIADPLVPVKIPHTRYLPLYYCFSYNAGAVGYRVVSDEAIEILCLEEKRAQRDFP